MRHARSTAAATLILGLMAADSATAQLTPTQQGLRPVQPMVADVDPLRQSLQRIQPGLGVFGQDSDSFVYRRVLPGGGLDPNKVYYIQPGISAQFDRSSYVDFQIEKDTYTARVIPPNTLFFLGTPPVPPAPLQPDSPQLINAQVDGRADAVNAVPFPQDSDLAPNGEWMVNYKRFRESQRRGVMESIDRALAEPAATTVAPPAAKP
jgi:hypothetical protein